MLQNIDETLKDKKLLSTLKNVVKLRIPVQVHTLTY